MARIEVVQNDTADLNFTVKDSDSNAVNLTGTTIEFRMYIQGSTTSKIKRACTITDATAGTCTVAITTGDFDTIGLYLSELKVTLVGGGIVTTYPKQEILVVETAPSAT
jgi:hypothetical protein